MQLGKGINKLADRYREDFFNDSVYLAGYSAIINHYKLLVPNPYSMVLISDSKSVTSSKCYKVYRTRYLPDDNVFGHIQFSLKYEGVDLLILKALFEKLSKEEVIELVTYKQTGQYCRRLWFLYEWLTQSKLDIDDLDSKSKYVDAIDTKIQFAIAGRKSKRHLVLNNLPGVVGYCPLVRKTDNILRHISQKYSDKLKASISELKQDILYRAAAYLTLKDSQSSFNIEGEIPHQNKAQRWARAIGQAGQNNLTQKEIERLQTIILGSDQRFIDFGYRKEGGWIGDRNRQTNEPIPEHISADHSYLEDLMSDWLDTYNMLLDADIEASVVAATMSFGFVFIHPLSDGNGRMHRYLFHHILSKKSYSPEGLIFPISAAIIEDMGAYKAVLKSYSEPLLNYIKYDITDDLNIVVTNDTRDYYSYWDATPFTEYLFDCIEKTVVEILPQEIAYIQHYEKFKYEINEQFSFPDKLVNLLANFLYQNKGTLLKNRREKEFSKLRNDEVSQIETIYNNIFTND